jgi:biopolymer transport protein TolR
MTRSRYKRRQLKIIQELPLTSLIDTALTLLIIFIVACPMLHTGIKVDVPQGSIKEDTGLSQQMVIVIDKDQNIFYNDRAVRPEDLASCLEPELLEHNAGTVCVKADQGVPYGFVMHIVEQVKSLQHIQHVLLITKKRA